MRLADKASAILGCGLLVGTALAGSSSEQAAASQAAATPTHSDHAFIKRQGKTSRVVPKTLVRTALPGHLSWRDDEVHFEVEGLARSITLPLGQATNSDTETEAGLETRCGRRACSCRGSGQGCELGCELCWILLEQI